MDTQQSNPAVQRILIGARATDAGPTPLVLARLALHQPAGWPPLFVVSEPTRIPADSCVINPPYSADLLSAFGLMGQDARIIVACGNEEHQREYQLFLFDCACHRAAEPQRPGDPQKACGCECHYRHPLIELYEDVEGRREFLGTMSIEVAELLLGEPLSVASDNLPR